MCIWNNYRALIFYILNRINAIENITKATTPVNVLVLVKFNFIIIISNKEKNETIFTFYTDKSVHDRYEIVVAELSRLWIECLRIRVFLVISVSTSLSNGFGA